MKEKRKKIGLALGSGGIKGIAHIGVIKVLKENNIPIDYIAGTSAGAIVGGIYARNRDISDAEQLVRGLGYRDLIRIFFDPRLHLGLLRGKNAISFLEKYIGDTKIEDLKIPFRAVASDIQTGKAVVFDKGKLSLAMRASSSVPFIFEPVKYNGHYLIDGGASQPVPVRIVKEMGADIVIAVNLDAAYFSSPLQKVTVVSLLKNSINLLIYNLAKENIKEADIVISPQIPDLNWVKIKQGEKLIAAGEEATRQVIPQLRNLLRE